MVESDQLTSWKLRESDPKALGIMTDPMTSKQVRRPCRHGQESGLTGRRPEELSKILGIPSGAFAAPLKAPLVAGPPHEVESEVAHDRHVLGSMPLA